MKRLREEGRHRVLDVPVLPVQKRLVRALANRRRCQILEGSSNKQQTNGSGGGGESFRFPPPDPEKARGGRGVKEKQAIVTSQVAADTSEIRDIEEEKGGLKSTMGGECGPPLKVMCATPPFHTRSLFSVILLCYFSL